MQVEVAELRDIRSWLDLAAEVEALFGDMLDNHRFYDALLRNIDRRSAYCVRERDGPPGAPLMGGMLFSPCRPNRPKYRIGWLALADRWRRRGVGRRLVEHAFRQLETAVVDRAIRAPSNERNRETGPTPEITSCHGFVKI